VGGNYIGTNVNSATGLGNGGNGISITDGADSNIIGGARTGQRNVISGNSGDGVRIDDATNNAVSGNYIGTSVAGTFAIANGGAGVTLRNGATGNVIGVYDGDVNEHNVISGNSADGIVITGSGTELNWISGNYIGVQYDGSTALGNGSGTGGGDGVRIDGGDGNQIGGDPTNNEGNVIANGTAATGGRHGNGITVLDAVHDAIFGNSIFDNAGVGIDLGDDLVTNNDYAGSGHTDDDDTGVNELQNTPVIASATIDTSGNLIVTFNVRSNPLNASYPLHVEIFVADSSSYQQGKVFLYATSFGTTDYSNGSMTVNLGSATALHVNIGDDVVATATDADGNTSEFSVSYTVT
jgi:hypothetical protein